MRNPTPTYLYQDLSKFQLPAGFRGRSGWYVQLWWLVQSLLIHPSPQFMYGWRRFWLRAFGARVGKNVIIRPSVRVTYPWKLTIGDYAWVGDRVELYTLGEIIIGPHAVVSQDSYLCTGSHDYRDPTFPIYVKPIHIGPEVWVAAGCFIAPGIEIGQAAVVAARSVVLTNIPPRTVVAGQPAKKLKLRNIA